MKKILLSTAILGSLLLGMASPAVVKADSQAQSKAGVGTYYVSCINPKCSSYGNITPHDVVGNKWVCRVCGYAR
ncbi:hypothetical protein ACQPU1_06265 [Clostridium paraputrificum]|uniref:hypothetical protein n=1 Tax=Clostridium TaxID=1485 RepID=UPI003D343D5C